MDGTVPKIFYNFYASVGNFIKVNERRMKYFGYQYLVNDFESKSSFNK